MTKIGNCFFAVTLFLFLSSLAFADVKVQAFADRKSMGLGDTIDVTVIVHSTDSVEVGEPKLPESFSNFEIMNSYTSSSTSSKLIQGARGMQFETLKTVEFHYMVAPKKQGTLPVSSFEVNVEGKSYKTVPFRILVSGQGSGANRIPPGGGGRAGSGGGPGVLGGGPGGGLGLGEDDPLDEAEKMFNELLKRQQQGMGSGPRGDVVPKNPNETFFIYLDLDKKEVYEGEQITASWYIYTKGNLLALDRLKFPDLKGFWKEIVEEVPALNFTQEILNGVAYRRALLASHALFPIKAGSAVIDEYKVKATMQMPQGPFGGAGGQAYTFTRSSDRVPIKVKPLPIEGKPQDFSGAVGQFEVQATVDNNEVPINQPFTLKIRFEGEGNAKLIELPTLSLPAGLESFDTKSDAKFFKNGRSFKEFQVLIIPREPGAVTIPALSLSLFDPKSGKYYAKKTEPLNLTVTGAKARDDGAGAGAGSSGAGGVGGGKGSAVGGAGSGAGALPAKPDLPPILTNYQGRTSLPLTPGPVVGIFAFLSLLILGWKARHELGHKEKKATLRELLGARMRKVSKASKAGDWRGASAQMTNVIYAVLGAISGEGGASKELRILLEKAPPSLRRDLGEDLGKTLDLFQFLTFAPEEAVGSKRENVASEIEKANRLLIRAIDHVDSDSKA